MLYFSLSVSGVGTPDFRLYLSSSYLVPHRAVIMLPKVST
jgi:hypothetical protein